ncbi:choice-of-anchor D domain-containing protein [Bradymonas sediminis]|uniref:Abnormal spindle-like microcephaly-associated protein ASH domain-containing protein n=1 Tax=Bradymonas sediminis TaxID=1548548 RepID=A0A2Z4FLY9_9DELT|nr:choice-of-anchor D domain-containing protein [Bradymonas sediminis]AWV89825.1 hypothetical protein DN745_10930 [Bradymonas sediminis]TDP76428.1 hypothetical protein DFR33_10257 [Bradymonas sediminis]
MALLERRSTILIGLLLALSLGLSTGCSDDDDGTDGGGGGIGGKEIGQVAATPNPITFETVALGQETSVNVMISNTGESTLRITNIALKEDEGDPPLDRDQEFFKDGEGWGEQKLNLEPGVTHIVRVRYKPVNQNPDSGSIVIESNDPSNPQFVIPVSTLGLAPQIFSPATVSFPRVTPPGPGSSGDGPWRGAWKMTQVQNTGEAPLSISEIKVKGNNSRFDFSIPQPTPQEIADGLAPDPDNDTKQWPATLAPTESFDLRVWFAPDTNNPEDDQLVFKSDDPSRPEYSVSLLGNSGTPCIEVSPVGEVDFALSSIGNVTQKTVTITNCSPSSKLKVQDIEITDDGGGVYAIKDGSLPAGLPDDEFVLDEGARANFVVNFSPTQEVLYRGAVRIKSNDASQGVLNLPLNGRGTNNACPTAVATAKVSPGGRAGTDIQSLPLETIQFDGSASSDPDGSVQRYEWTILSAPAASSSRILPTGDPRPTMFMDINGEYKVELKVYDDQNTVSCGEPAIVTIMVNSDSDIHIQLTWTSNGGADNDLDLHYMHPNGSRWAMNSNGWDCYYNNKTPDWNVPGGNPTLDIDDLYGPGPENITHNNLEDVTYKIGVHHYSDYGNGPAYASVEVRNNGVLTYEARDKLLTNDQFWLVGFLGGTNHTVVPADTVTAGYP